MGETALALLDRLWPNELHLRLWLVARPQLPGRSHLIELEGADYVCILERVVLLLHELCDQQLQLLFILEPQLLLLAHPHKVINGHPALFVWSQSATYLSRTD